MGNINLDTDFYESEDPIWNPALLTIPVPGIRRMVNLAADLDDVIHLSIGQPDFKPPGHVIQAGVDALNAGQLSRLAIADRVLESRVAAISADAIDSGRQINGAVMTVVIQGLAQDGEKLILTE